jgi:steroid 5-alpha reductase family enzyme
MTFAVTFAALVVLLAGTYCLGVRTGNHGVMDVAWGLGIALAGIVGSLSSLGHGVAARRWVLVVAAVVWGVRLAVHVAVRLRGCGEDPRYRDLLDRAPGNRHVYALRVVYLPQLLILWLASLPLQAGMLATAPFGALGVAGGVIWVAGFVFETVGDWQLARFRANPAHHGQIMDRGLWRYTRHPNYFGDACMWWGLFALSYGSPIQLVTLISPVLMTVILTRGTGQALTERRMTRNRPGYASYVARTSGFVPLPPRHGRA